jgi:hypothetical protein
VKQEKDTQGKDLHRLSGLLKISRFLPQVRRLLPGLLLKFLPKKVHELDSFFYPYFYLEFYDFLLTFVFMNLTDFKKLLRKYPADKIEEYKRLIH